MSYTTLPPEIHLRSKQRLAGLRVTTCVTEEVEGRLEQNH